MKRIFRLCGVEVLRRNASTSEDLRVRSILQRLNINLVLDVGANIGQFSSIVRYGGYLGDILAYEPSAAIAKVFRNRFSCDPKVSLIQAAVGAYSHIAKINLSRNAVSSSILAILDAHTSVTDAASYIGAETVEVVTLNETCKGLISKETRAFLKIDVQGYEWEVLQGATDVLNCTQAILCELSLVPLYSNQKLWLEIVNFLTEEGFELWSFTPGFSDISNGRTLQMDGLFVRKLQPSIYVDPLH